MLNDSLSEGFGELESLQTLNLELCISLTSLPAGMHTIISFYFIVTVMIHLSPPMNLELTVTRPLTVPLSEGFGELTNLETLKLNVCEKLMALPEGMHTIISIYFI